MLNVWRSGSLSDFPQKNTAIPCLWTRLNRNHPNRIHNHNWHAPKFLVECCRRRASLGTGWVGWIWAHFLFIQNCWNPIAQNVAQGMFEAVETFQCELSWILKSHEGNSFGNPLFQVPFYHEQWNHSHAPHLTRHPAQKTPELSMLQETKDHTDKGRQQIHIVYKYQHPNHIRWSLCLPCTCFEYSELSRYHKLNHKIQKMFNQCLPPTLPQLLELLGHPILPVLKLLLLTFSWK